MHGSFNVTCFSVMCTNFNASPPPKGYRCVRACISRDYSIRSVHAKESREINIYMEMERKTFGLLMLLVIILASRDKVVMKVEGRVCESQSHRFKGPCTGNHNCALVCRNEGFSGGKCHGFRRRCFCTKLCPSTTN